MAMETDDRVERLRAAIAGGRYSPDPLDVAEAVLAWVAPPEVLAGGPVPPPSPDAGSRSRPTETP